MATGTYKFVSFILNVTFVGLLTTATAGSASGSASLIGLLFLQKFQTRLR